MGAGARDDTPEGVSGSGSARFREDMSEASPRGEPSGSGRASIGERMSKVSFGSGKASVREDMSKADPCELPEAGSGRVSFREAMSKVDSSEEGADRGARG